MYDIEENNKLVKKYPWLKIRNVFTNKEIDNNKLTWLDDMPEGWRISFGLNLIEDLDKILRKANYENKYQIVQIKEKWRISSLV